MPRNIDELRKSREEKLAQIKKLGLNPYPTESKERQPINQVLADFSQLEKEQKDITVSGRIVLIRLHGKIAFAQIVDAKGKTQLLFKQDELKEEFKNIKLIDLGDILEITGSLFRTKTEEKTILVKEFNFLAKAILPLPEKWHGLKDLEIKQRQRYLDLLSNEKVRERFERRSKLIAAFRSYLIDNEFLEVETPVLEKTPGGADAEAFVTKHKRLDLELFLRISLELHLKRLIVGGYEKVFEIGKVFRNEGLSREHLQEFTMLECYWAYSDARKLLKFIQDGYLWVLKKVYGTTIFEIDGKKIDFKLPWKKVDYDELLLEYSGVERAKIKPSELIAILDKNKIPYDKTMGMGKLLDQLYKKMVRPHLWQPTILTGHPLAISPLAKQDSQHPDKSDRFQIVCAGMEIGNGYSELNDPLEQRKRFIEQAKLREQGDKEAQMIDEDYLEALSYGMPPTAGFGLGLDRFFTITENLGNIRESVLFPTFREK